MASEKRTLSFSEENFDREVLKSGEPALVDFTADWCPPCRAISPVIDELAVDYDGVVKVGKVNIDDNESLAAEYSVASIPTLLLFKDGEVVERVTGVVPKAQLVEKLTALAGQPS